MTTEIAEAPTYHKLRITIPALEALRRAGNRVEEDGDTLVAPEVIDSSIPPSLQSVCARTYRVTLSRPPAKLVAVLAPIYSGGPGRYSEYGLGLRLSEEGPFPGEHEAAWHERGHWIGCPRCGSALVWNEAGYVPGRRICLRGHHAQLSRDGRFARARRGP